MHADSLQDSARHVAQAWTSQHLLEHMQSNLTHVHFICATINVNLSAGVQFSLNGMHSPLDSGPDACIACYMPVVPTQAKLCQLSRLEERLDVKLAIAAELPGQFEGLARQQAAGEAAAEALKKDVKVCTPCKHGVLPLRGPNISRRLTVAHLLPADHLHKHHAAQEQTEV
jgi:hypothetical protein